MLKRRMIDLRYFKVIIDIVKKIIEGCFSKIVNLLFLCISFYFLEIGFFYFFFGE